MYSFKIFPELLLPADAAAKYKKSRLTKSTLLILIPFILSKYAFFAIQGYNFLGFPELVLFVDASCQYTHMFLGR